MKRPFTISIQWKSRIRPNAEPQRPQSFAEENLVRFFQERTLIIRFNSAFLRVLRVSALKFFRFPQQVSGLALLLLFALTISGCTSKSTARAEARAAFYAGQAKAMQEQRDATLPRRAPGNTVAIVGPVKCPALTWTPDLTLMKTIVAAEYVPAGEPGQIIITRDGQQIPVTPAILLNGQDIPMLPGDVVELRP